MTLLRDLTLTVGLIHTHKRHLPQAAGSRKETLIPSKAPMCRVSISSSNRLGHDPGKWLVRYSDCEHSKATGPGDADHLVSDTATSTWEVWVVYTGNIWSEHQDAARAKPVCRQGTGSSPPGQQRMTTAEGGYLGLAGPAS